MNTVLVDLLKSIDDARKKVSDAEDDRDSFLEPILLALGASRGCISACSIDGEYVRVTRSGSCRGCPWDEPYTFPSAIFFADDPLKAAAEYVSAQKLAKVRADYDLKLAKVKQLQEEMKIARKALEEK